LGFRLLTGLFLALAASLPAATINVTQSIPTAYPNDSVGQPYQAVITNAGGASVSITALNITIPPPASAS
jgi:hypothetical protein